MSLAASQTRESDGAEHAHAPAPSGLERVGWLIFAAVAAAASALILWLGRGATFSLDELIWLMETPDLGLGDAFEPHNGHLVATTRLLYKVILETVGTDYLTFRLLTLAAVVLTAALFFAYASRRIGKVAALAPALIVLLFGSDAGHLLTGNGFTVLFALACGLAALLALERDDRAGDVAACALLCLGVATYTVALPFVVGVGVAVILRQDRWRRIWIAAVPVALYGIWWLHAAGSDGDPQSQTTAINILLVPSWGFQSLSALLGAVSGLDYDFATDSAVSAGPTLALIAIAAAVWRITRGSVPASLWAALGILIALWASGALAAGLVRQPDNSRYFYPLLITTFLVAVWAAAGMRWTRGRLIALYAIAAVGLASNMVQLRNEGNNLRNIPAPATRIQLGALDLAGDRADPKLDFDAAAEAASYSLPYAVPGANGETPVDSYLRFADRYGALGYSAEELRGRSEAERALADSILIRALGISILPAEGAQVSDACLELGQEPGQPDAVHLAPGAGVVLEAVEGPSEVSLRRFSDQAALPVGTVTRGEPAVLQPPPDGAPDPWLVTVSAPTSLCAIR